jgi:deoxyribonuclease V
VWPTSPEELIETQQSLSAADPEPWHPRGATDPERAAAIPGRLAIGACAIVFPRGLTGRGARGDPAWAAAAVLLRRRVVAEATVASEAAGPYLPGLLALREGPGLEAAVRALPVTPDVLLVDATGRDHPRRAGLALHLGAVTGLATVGVTHRPLLAEGPWPEDERGAFAPLSLGHHVVGAWLRTRRGARPVAVHPGWRTALEDAIDVVLRASHGHRTPEALRYSRHLARIARANG